MPHIEQNGPGFTYELSIKRNGEQHEQVILFDDWRISSYEIAVPHAYMLYEVFVQARNADGYSLEPPKVYMLRSGEDGK